MIAKTARYMTYIQGETRPLLVNADERVKDNQLQGKICIHDVENNVLHEVVDEEAGYDNIQSVKYKDKTYIVYGRYEDGLRSIYFKVQNAQEQEIEREIVYKQKVDNISVAIHEEMLYIAMELYTTEEVAIVCYVVALNNISNIRYTKVTDKERAYKPQLISQKDVLYMVYESYYIGSYHLMMRVLEKDARKFTQGIEVGNTCLNNQSPKLWKHQDELYITWEQSSPLFTDYVWQPPNPKLRTVYMPSFGHGWRVYTKMCCRKIKYVEGYLNVMAIEQEDGCSDELAIQTEEASGEPNLFIHNDTLFLLFVEYAGEGMYQIALQYYSDGRFESVVLGDVKCYERETPPWVHIGEKLYMVINNPGEAFRQIEVDLSNIQGHLPYFVQIQNIKLSTVRETPHYIKEERQNVNVGEEIYTLFWGDLHMHSNVSRCSRHDKFHCTSLKDKNRVSRDVGRLDFALLTDHETMSDSEWALTKKAADFNDLNDAFTCFLGYEWTSSQLGQFHNYGHYNILYRNDGPLMRIHDGTYDRLEKVWDALSPDDAMTIPHHPGDDTHPVDWNYFDAEFVPLVEIYQVRGSYECDGCEYDPFDYGRGTNKGNSVQAGLNKGYRFGFTSGGEHEGVGITGVFASQLTRDAIFEALKARRVYGTTSEKIYITYFVNDTFMGGECTAREGNLYIRGEISGTDKLDYIKLVSNKEEIDITHTYNEATQSYKVSLPAEGIQWIYVRVKQVDGHVAWVSPVFIEK